MRSPGAAAAAVRRRAARRAARLRVRLVRAVSRRRRPGSVARFAGFRVRINDGMNFAVLYEDIFARGVYGFGPAGSSPRILDGGANIGLATLYWKRRWPDARITAFEPDPTVLPYLEENVARNGLRDVEIVPAALSTEDGRLRIVSDAKYSSSLAGYASAALAGTQEFEVDTVSLRPYLEQPVDLLKLNIEGAETDVLLSCRDLLHNVRELVVEYHHLPGVPRRLHHLLALLDDEGFDYAVGDFGLATYAGARPPVALDPGTSYYRHVYARRLS